ncbi:MAG: DUF2516 family protein [Candidatus Nanopelagicales bacterium]|jgi:uncharacterized membrane protein|nr:DUF2516 family protein [Candidatus Nanopelagicales bacterium]
MFPTLGAWLLIAISLATLAGAAFAFIDCLRRRPDAFPAVGRRSKQLWVALTGAAALIGLINVALWRSPIGLLGIVAIVISAVYLLDIRPRIIEITGGRR